MHLQLSVLFGRLMLYAFLRNNDFCTHFKNKYCHWFYLRSLASLLYLLKVFLSFLFDICQATHQNHFSTTTAKTTTENREKSSISFSNNLNEKWFVVRSLCLSNEIPSIKSYFLLQFYFMDRKSIQKKKVVYVKVKGKKITINSVLVKRTEEINIWSSSPIW